MIAGRPAFTNRFLLAPDTGLGQNGSLVQPVQVDESIAIGGKDRYTSSPVERGDSSITQGGAMQNTAELFATAPARIASIPWQDNIRHAISDPVVCGFVKKALLCGYQHMSLPGADNLVEKIFERLQNRITVEPVEDVLENIRTSLSADWHGRSVRAVWSDYYRDVEAEFITDLIAPNLVGESILEVGTGRGWVSYKLMQKAAHIKSITGTDVFDYREPSIKAHSKLNFLQVTPENPLPFEDNSFDTIIVVYVLHHSPLDGTRVKLLEELRRVAKKRVIVLEDTYPLTNKKPLFRFGQSEVIDDFMSLSPIQKIYALTFSCTFSNRVDGGGKNVPTPGVFYDAAALEDQFTGVFGKGRVKTEFLGIPKSKVYLNAEGLFVIEK